MPAPVLISIGWWIFAYIHDWCEGLEWILWIVIYQWAILIYHQIIYGLYLHINKALIFTMWLMINLLGTLSIWCAGLKSALDIHVVCGHAPFWGAPIISGPQKWKNALDGINAVPFGTYKKKHSKAIGNVSGQTGTLQPWRSLAPPCWNPWVICYFEMGHSDVPGRLRNCGDMTIGTL